MPKIVDHQQRRQALADAIVNLVAQGGLSSASVRNVATASGWSTGTVRHYFPTQADLKAFAADAIAHRLRHSVTDRVPANPHQLTRRELSTRLLETVLPFSEDQRTDYQLWIELMRFDTERPPEERSLIWSEQRWLCRNAVAIAAGIPRSSDNRQLFTELADARQERWAGYLHIYIDGLASHVMYMPHHVSIADAQKQLGDLISDMATSLGLVDVIDQKIEPESPS